MAVALICKSSLLLRKSHLWLRCSSNLDRKANLWSTWARKTRSSLNYPSTYRRMMEMGQDRTIVTSLPHQTRTRTLRLCPGEKYYFLPRETKTREIKRLKLTVSICSRIWALRSAGKDRDKCQPSKDSTVTSILVIRTPIDLDPL